MTTQIAKPAATIADDPAEHRVAAILDQMEEGPWGFPVVLDIRPLLGGRTLAELDPEQYRTGQVCPDFVAEILSPNDSLAYLRLKMDEYIAAGVRLGWLIDPRNRRVTIYRPEHEPEEFDNPEILSGEDVMPGFEFRVRTLIFDAARQ